MSLLLTSVSPVIALLDEPEWDLKVHALSKLDALADVFWAEIAAVIDKIEELYDNQSFQHRQLAAAVASKVFYHLEELDDALKYALGAGDLFDISVKSEYVDTLIAKCIDEYIRVRVSLAEDPTSQERVDSRLEQIVERMFDRCFEDGEYKQALGIALEARRIDKVKDSILLSGAESELLQYGLELCRSVVPNRAFRHEILREIVQIYQSHNVPDYISICQCLLYLEDAGALADVLDSLLRQSINHSLTAYQVAFELSESENQAFLLSVSSALPEMDAATEGEANSDSYSNRVRNLKYILSGLASVEHHTQFLYTQCNTDVLLVKNIKEKVDSRNSVAHNSAVLAHALMFSGTTRDQFIRDNLDWLAKASNWAKFSATACFGVIHKGHYSKSMKLLEPYLPSEGSQGSPYLEGGALYGLGIIHANRGGDKTDYLLNVLTSSTNEIVQHGACLGLGLNAMANGSDTVYNALRDVLYHDNAVAGEAAGLAMGLVHLGSGASEAVEEMLTYSRETQHEKIIRGLAMGLALIMSGREEQADLLVGELLGDKDPILRYGGCYALALAYAATANNGALQKLLHVAVSDVSHDVRRAAVTAIGFVLANVPERVPRVVALLAESYNAHVRYGACLAVGVACAGSGSKAAQSLLEPLLKDRVDYVRQGAMIANAMVLVQHNEKQEPKVKEFRALLTSAIESKLTDTMTRLGAVLASGILDAGGRNVTIALISPGGHKRLAAVVGMSIFTHYWYWYPLIHLISLSFSPTSVIGLNKDLKLPRNFKIRSSAKPSLFAFTPHIVVKKEEKKKQEYTAELSISAKAKARAQKRKQEMDGGMDIEEEEPAVEEPKDHIEEKNEEPEPDFEILSNPARVLPAQLRVIEAVADQRYNAVKRPLYGITLLTDSSPSEPEDLIVPEEPTSM